MFFLTTALLQFKGTEFKQFQSEIFPNVQQLVEDLFSTSPNLIIEDQSVKGTKKNSEPKLQLPTNLVTLHGVNPQHNSVKTDEKSISYTNIETTIKDLCQTLKKLNLNTLLQQLLNTQNSLTEKVNQIDTKLDKLSKEKVTDHHFKEVKANEEDISERKSLTLALTNVEDFLKLIPPDLKAEIQSRDKQIEILIAEITKKDNEMKIFQKERNKDIEKANRSAIKPYEENLSSLKLQLEEAERELFQLKHDNQKLSSAIKPYEEKLSSLELQPEETEREKSLLKDNNKKLSIKFDQLNSRSADVQNTAELKEMEKHLEKLEIEKTELTEELTNLSTRSFGRS